MKVFYQLMAKGIKNYCRIGNQYFKLPEPWNAPYYSKEHYVVANDEESALNHIRSKLKNKYEGFRISKVEDNA